MPIQTLSSNTRYLRAKKGWTQAQVAEMVGSSQPMIAHYENKNSFIKLSVLIKLSELFGCTIDALCRHDFNKHPVVK